MRGNAKRYTDYLTAIRNRGLTPDDPRAATMFNNPNSQEDYMKLRDMFRGLQYSMKLSDKDLTDLAKFNNGELFGSTYMMKPTYGAEGATGGSTNQLVKSPEYQRVEALNNRMVADQKKTHSSVNSFADALSANTTIKRLSYYPTTGTATGKKAIDLVNHIAGSDVTRSYYSGDTDIYKDDGTLKDGISTASGGSRDANNDPLAYLARTTGKNPLDFVSNMHMRMIGNKLAVSGTLDDTKLGPAYSKLNFNGSKDFTVVFDDVDGGLRQTFGNPALLYRNPAAAAMFQEINPVNSKVDNSVDKNIPYLQTTGHVMTFAGTKVKKTDRGYAVKVGDKWQEEIPTGPNGAAEPITDPEQVKALIINNIYNPPTAAKK